MIAQAFDWVIAKITNAAGLEAWKVHTGGAVTPASNRVFLIEASPGDQETTHSGVIDTTIAMTISAIGSQSQAIEGSELVKAALVRSNNVLDHGGFNLEWNAQISKHMGYRQYALRLPTVGD